MSDYERQRESDRLQRQQDELRRQQQAAVDAADAIRRQRQALDERAQEQKRERSKDESRRVFYCPNDSAEIPAPGYCSSCRARMRLDDEEAAKKSTESIFSEIQNEIFEKPFDPAEETRRATAHNARIAYENGYGRAGESAAFQTHSTASAVRSEFGMSGADYQSAHIVPQAALRALQDAGFDCSPSSASTILLSKEIHRALDSGFERDGVLVGGWLDEWRRAVSRNEEITVDRLRRMIDRAIEALPTATAASEALGDGQSKGDRTMELSQEIKQAMSWRLHQELYRDYQLSPDQVIVPGNKSQA